MEQESQKAIEITEFVPASQVDPIYFDKPYYLGPDKGGEKAFRLLNEAMKQTGRVALAKWAARGKQYLVMIRPKDKGLVMQQLLYADEVKSISEVPIPDAEIKDAELKLATQLIEQIASDKFHPEHYEDEVRKRYHEAIQRKVEGQEITAAPEAPRAQIIDLMEALKASLAKKSARSGRRRSRGGRGRSGHRHRRPAGPPRASRARRATHLRTRQEKLTFAAGSRPLGSSGAGFPGAGHPGRRRLRALPPPALVVPRGRVRKVKRFRDEDYWGRPVPGFGDPKARLLVVGLAPAAHGGNRTGRVFTGDRSGDFLFAALHRAGFASQAASVARGDGLRLEGAYVAPLARCAPPANKPTPDEIANCREYLAREWALLPELRAVLALGRVALDGFVALLRATGRVPPRTRFAFGHGVCARPRRRPRAVRLVPPVAAEHLHRPADPAQLRRGDEEHRPTPSRRIHAARPPKGHALKKALAAVVPLLALATPAAAEVRYGSFRSAALGRT